MTKTNRIIILYILLLVNPSNFNFKLSSIKNKCILIWMGIGTRFWGWILLEIIEVL